ncbi:Rpn family recombination-promoting nuclease/putative transposase [Limosilactobacillus sp.]|jgi:predicted transposase/invertase (TIGR01784 family)|uniref:Rpn family recombination-promoting nuclease/putative transposase n=1 Tax=Limosilactobacillus sp. TaxID=2773925 RepID=UPI0025B886F8|nr:Rpn family recombination-promoting nuclease/putative transposase [Limosilactobacillus sp.]MCH3922666.1 Rpn family recombination-promoting nuclease/putative transposase [Limosilactobacillus sp.]MCH3927349.1 Rpn family recombination-promoting nuclease/putative transposase [Limosilactobacillus sp.]
MVQSTSWEAQLQAASTKWEHLTLADDRMFGMVMEDNQICLEVLRRIFPQLNIQHVQQVETQKQVNTMLGVKAPRFDVYVRDDQKRTYILEMQVKNNHNLVSRARHYLDQADFELLKPGDDYKQFNDLPVYVVFFCDFDYYGLDFPDYSFDERCLRQLSLSSAPGRYKLFFNAKTSDFRDKIGLKGFLQLMYNERTPGDELAERIYEKMERIKRDPERRRIFMKYEMDLMDAKDEGVAIGLKNGEAIGLKKGRKQGRKQGIAQGRNEQQAKDILLMIKVLKNKHFSNETIEHDLMSSYGLSRQEAQKYMQ